MDCSPPVSFVHGDSPGRNAGVGCHALLQGIFPTQGSNQLSCIAGGFFYVWVPGKPKNTGVGRNAAKSWGKKISLEKNFLWFFFFLNCNAWLAGSRFPGQGSKQHQVQWKRRVLTTGSPGKSLLSFSTTSESVFAPLSQSALRNGEVTERTRVWSSIFTSSSPGNSMFTRDGQTWSHVENWARPHSLSTAVGAEQPLTNEFRGCSIRVHPWNRWHRTAHEVQK